MKKADSVLADSVIRATKIEFAEFGFPPPK